MTAKTPRKSDRRRVIIGVLVFLGLMLALAAAWRWTPLHEYADPRSIAHWLEAKADKPWMMPLVALIYVLASLVLFPNTVLCLAVILALGPIAGTLYAFGGSLAAALTGHQIGRRGGRLIEKFRIKRFNHLTGELRRGGFMQVLALRLLPVAPFTVTNILSGAARVPLLPFAAATLVGISPYILTFAVLGRQTRRLLSDPTPLDAAVAAVVVAVGVIAMWQARVRAAAHSR